MDEDDLVALAVAVEVVGLALGDAHADLDVGVVLQHPPAEHACPRTAPGPCVCVSRCTWVSGTHSSSSILLELADVLHAAGREQVVEDRLVAGEALEAHDLLDEQVLGLLIAELHVPLGRDAAQATRSASVAPLGRVHHAPDEQLGAGRRVLDGPREGAVEGQVEAGSSASRRCASSPRWWRRRACRPRRRRRGRAAGCGRAPCRPGRRSARRGRGRARAAGRAARSSSSELSVVKRGSSTVPWPERPLDVVPLAEHRHEAQVVLARTGSRIASSACSKRASTRIMSTSPAPSNGAVRVSSNGCCHLPWRYSASVITAISSSLMSSRMRGIIPCVFSLRPRVDRGPGPAGRCPA